MGEAENPSHISCALGSQHHKGFLQALLIISFHTLKEKLKCWWQMASFITFNWLTVLLSLWNTHFGPKHWKKNMPFVLVCCQVTLKNVQEVFARPVHRACLLQQRVSSCTLCCSLERRLSNCSKSTFLSFSNSSNNFTRDLWMCSTRSEPSAEGRTSRSSTKWKPGHWGGGKPYRCGVACVFDGNRNELQAPEGKSLAPIPCFQPLVSFAVPQQSPSNNVYMGIGGQVGWRRWCGLEKRGLNGEMTYYNIFLVREWAKGKQINRSLSVL